MGEWQTYVISTLAVIVSALVSVLWWFIRDRIAQRRRQEDLLHHRLQAGSETMAAIKNDVELVKVRQVEQSTQWMSVAECRKQHEEHAHTHERIEKQIDRLHGEAAETRREISKLDGKVSSGFDRVMGMMAKVTLIPKGEEE